jgi:uncharacterized protein YutE (UPF0331/DUF86 family)
MINKEFIRIEISFIQNELSKFKQFGSYCVEKAADNPLESLAIQKFLGRIIEQAVRINQYLIIELTKKNDPPLDYAETFTSLVNYQVYGQDFADRIIRSVETNNTLIAGFMEKGNDRIYTHVYECVDDYYKYCENILNFIDLYPVKSSN